MSRQPWRWVAEREGRCAGCGQVIVKGSQTQKNPGSGWMHRECGQRDWQAKLDKQKKDTA